MDLPLQLPYHTCEAKTLYWSPENRSDELPRILRKLRVETVRNIPTYPHILLILRHKINVFCLHRMWTERHKFQPGFMICSREFIFHARWRKKKKKKTCSRSLIQALISWCFFMRVCFCVGASEPVRTSVCPGRRRGAVVDTARASESF